VHFTRKMLDAGYWILDAGFCGIHPE